MLSNRNSVFILFFILASSMVFQGAAAASPHKKNKKDKSEVVHPQLSNDDQVKLERDMLDGEKYKVLEDWDNAVKSYTDALSIDPTCAEAHFQLSQIYSETHKLSDAQTEADIASRLDGSNRWYLEQLASVYLSEGKSKEAIETYKTLVQKFPGVPDYYLNLGFLYSRESQFENAIKIYDQFEKSFGIDENVVIEKKNLYLQLNKFNEAVNEIHKLVEAFPGETQYMLMEAELYNANKMKDKAAEIYKKVLAVEPDNAQALLALAELDTQSGDSTQSIDNIKKIFRNPNVDIDTKVKILYPYLEYWDIRKAQKQDAFDLAEILTTVHPTEAKAWAIKGDLYYLDNQDDKALQSYLQSLKLSKAVFQVWQQVMLLYNLKKDWTDLQQTCNDALELFPNQALIYLFKGGAEFQNKDYDNAVKSYAKGAKMSVDDDKLRAQFYANLGDAYHSLNKYDESDSAYEQSLKLDPENAYVLNNYSYYLSVRKANLERAKQMSAYSNKLDPDNSSFLDTYAWILFQMGDYNGAREWIEKAFKAGGDKSGTIVEHYGDTLYMLGNKDQALEYWKKAKDLGTDSGTIERKIAEQKYVE